MAKRGDTRRRSDKLKALRAKLEPQLTGGLLHTEGAQASNRWLLTLKLTPVPRWFVEISMHAEADAATWFGLHIYAEEWGFVFERADRTSWIRVTDIAFVHGRDDFQLRDRAPDLLSIHALVSDLERAHGPLQRERATIRTNLPGATEAIRAWLDRDDRGPAAGK